MRFSCIIPAYNEGPRIAKVLSTALACPELDEVIVVNDGSTDNTLDVIKSFADLRLHSINIEKNQGKLSAFFMGINKSTGTHIVMLDADYSGFNTDHIRQLIDPVKKGIVKTTMMMWKESLPICKLLKHDIFSGARVLPKFVFDNTEFYLSGYGYGLEAKMNEVIYQNRLSVLSLYFPEVSNPSKGGAQLRRQAIEIIRSVAIWKIVRQAWYIYRQQP